MTNATIRISTSATAGRTPAVGFAGALGATNPGASDDTTIEVSIEDLSTTAAVVDTLHALLPSTAVAFASAVQSAPLVGEVNVFTGPEDLIETDVLDTTAEAEEKARRKAQRKRAREIVLHYGINGEHRTVAEDAKDAVKHLEAEGLLR